MALPPGGEPSTSHRYLRHAAGAGVAVEAGRGGDGAGDRSGERGRLSEEPCLEGERGCARTCMTAPAPVAWCWWCSSCAWWCSCSGAALQARTPPRPAPQQPVHGRHLRRPAARPGVRTSTSAAPFTGQPRAVTSSQRLARDTVPSVGVECSSLRRIVVMASRLTVVDGVGEHRGVVESDTSRRRAPRRPRGGRRAASPTTRRRRATPAGRPARSASHFEVGRPARRSVARRSSSSASRCASVASTCRRSASRRRVRRAEILRGEGAGFDPGEVAADVLGQACAASARPAYSLSSPAPVCPNICSTP